MCVCVRGRGSPRRKANSECALSFTHTHCTERRAVTGFHAALTTNTTRAGGCRELWLFWDILRQTV
mgnify:CR=1 FL=1